MINANLSNPGRDWILSTQIAGITPSGEVSAPANLNFLVTINLDCRRWVSYKLDGFILSPSGMSYPMAFGSGNYSDQYPSFDVADYCFLVSGYCGWLSFTGTASLPSDALAGSYAIKLHTTTQGLSLGVDLPVLEKTMTFSNIIEVRGAVVTTPLATIADSSSVATSAEPPTFNSSYSEDMIAALITPFAVPTYESKNRITGYIARAISPSGNISIGKAVDVRAEGTSYKINWDGLGVTPGIWLIEVAGINAAGQGSWSVPQAVTVPLLTQKRIATATPGPAGKVQKMSSITCVNGKLKKKVTALKPSCPKGYKRK